MSKDPISYVKELAENIAGDVSYDFKSTNDGFISTIKFGSKTFVGPACLNLQKAKQECARLFVRRLRFPMDLASSVVITKHGEDHKAIFKATFGGREITASRKEVARKMIISTVLDERLREMALDERREIRESLSKPDDTNLSYRSMVREMFKTWRYQFDKSLPDVCKTKQEAESLCICFIHPSILSEPMFCLELQDISGEKSYERYEFLGDSVLQLYVTEKLVQDNSKMSPGKMTALRQKYTSNDYLCSVGETVDFNKMIIHRNKIYVPNNKVIADVTEAFIGWLHSNNKEYLSVFLETFFSPDIDLA